MKIILIIIALFLGACSEKNKNVSSITNSSKNVIEHVIKAKPECKEVGVVCNEQIDVVNQICQNEIKEERSTSWREGFLTGIAFLFVALLSLAILLRKFLK